MGSKHRIYGGLSGSSAQAELLKPSSRYAGRELPSWLQEPWAQVLKVAIVGHNDYAIVATSSTHASKQRALNAARAIEDLERIVEPEHRPDTSKVEAKLAEILGMFKQGGIRIVPEHRQTVVLDSFSRTHSILSRPEWHGEEWAKQLLAILDRQWAFTSYEGGKHDVHQANTSLATLRELMKVRARPNPDEIRKILSGLRNGLHQNRIKLTNLGGSQTTMVTRGLLNAHRLVRNVQV